ncbi:MAG TPA: RNA polymerase sigma factor [Cyclobacteriaceae bacterium]|nr:RNA polymerase sigma factor [Cyclobacteriaceae bacterium]HRW99092.1 RNA polymerase sigma factor [Cyclobacteriaceae bacterium]
MDIQAFETKVLPSKNKLFRFALRLLGNEDEAQDVVQEVLIKVWNGRESMHQINNWEAWCMRLTKNLSLDRLRAQQRKATDSLVVGMEVRQDGLSPHEKTELTESMQQVSKLMASLPEKQRQVMHLRDVEGYSYNEICEILELDMSQVKISLFRARNSVREKLVKINAYGL